MAPTAVNTVCMVLPVKGKAELESLREQPPTAADEARSPWAADVIDVGIRARSRERKGNKSRTACANFAHADPQLTDYTPQSPPSIMGATDSLCGGCCVIAQAVRRREGRLYRPNLPPARMRHRQRLRRLHFYRMPRGAVAPCRAWPSTPRSPLQRGSRSAPGGDVRSRAAPHPHSFLRIA